MAHIQEGVVLSKAVVICCCCCHSLSCLRGLSLPVIQPAANLEHNLRQSAKSNARQVTKSAAALLQSAVRSTPMGYGHHQTGSGILQTLYDNPKPAILNWSQQAMLL